MYTDERQFVKTANQHLAVLEQTWSDVNADGFTQVEMSTRNALDQIKYSANTVQARGVYRAAVLCEDVLVRTSTDCTAKLSSAMTSLKHLVDQYRDGLLEIDPEFDWEETAVNMDEQVLVDNVPTVQESLESKHKIAAQNLFSLMELVREPKHHKALSFLMMPTQIEQNYVEVIETKSLSFDALMHPLNNLILSEARHSGKPVSISYAADFARISAQHSAPLRNLLEIVCLNVVANGIVPNKPGSVSQISITGQGKPDDLYFLISWRGRELSESARRNPHFAKAITELECRGGEVKYNATIFADSGNSRHTMALAWPRTEAISLPNLNSSPNGILATGGM